MNLSSELGVCSSMAWRGSLGPKQLRRALTSCKGETLTFWSLSAGPLHDGPTRVLAFGLDFHLLQAASPWLLPLSSTSPQKGKEVTFDSLQAPDAGIGPSRPLSHLIGTTSL